MKRQNYLVKTKGIYIYESEVINIYFNWSILKSKIVNKKINQKFIHNFDNKG